MSERLSRRGRVGAEELTDTLSSVFADLLTSAYTAGGSLLKFGGDALLLLFDGADHSVRAATSAIRMRTALADRGPIKTVGGSIRLRMSVGVHSGPVHFFRVGTSHKEFLVTGPSASAVCTMESTAVAGEILVSPACVAALPPRFLGESKGPGVLLRRLRNSDTDAASYPQVPLGVADLQVGIPVALRDALLSGVEPEHRLVTIAFVHFDGTDGFLAERGEEAITKALDELVGTVQEAADGEKVTFLGSDLDHDGGKLILVGGAPRAFGDDEGRVMRAVRRIVDANTTLPVRIGVHRGHVFVGEVGPTYRRTYTVMGDTVNLAARLMAKAAPGEIIATPDVIENAQTVFETTALEPFLVKGKTAPIVAFQIGATKGRRRRAGSDALPFVGRDTELAALAERWAMTRERQGSLVAIFGDAGIGKSRLMREFVGHAPDVRTITAYCETYQATTPYFAARYLLRGALGLSSEAPTARALQQVVERLAPDLVPSLPLIGAVAAIEVDPTPEVDALDPEFRRLRTIQVVADLLDKALTSPCALVVDDAHWLDDLSGELLVGLAAAAKNHSWLVVLAGRREADSYSPPLDAVDLALHLHPLDASAAGALLTSADQSAHIRPDQREAILQRSGGNPLFLEALAARVGSALTGELPDTLETLVAAEIDALNGADRNAVRLAAVLGPIFDTALLLELVGERDVDVLLRRTARFLERASGSALRFRNQTFRDVAYESLSFARRRDLHARAMTAIEAAAFGNTDEQAEVLSFHALHARDFKRCWRYGRVAATRAETSYANTEAALLFERALAAGAQLGGEAEAIAETWELLGDVSLKAGTFDRAKRAFDRARTLADPGPATQARLCRKEALTALHRGQGSAATRWLNRGLAFVAEATDAEELRVRSDLRLTYGELLQRRRRNAEGREWAVLAAQDASASNHTAGLARACSVLGMAAIEGGDASQLHYLEDARRLWEQHGGLRDAATVTTLLGVAAYMTGDWDQAADYYERAGADYARAGDVVTAGYGTCNLADILIDQGRGAEVVDGLVEVVRVWRSVGHPDPIPGALVNLGRCALERGDMEGALAHFSEARALTPASASARVESDYWLAECALRSGDAPRALATVDAALRDDPAEGSIFTARLHRLRGLALASLGRFAEAISAERTSLQTARNRSAPFEVAQAVLALDACLTAEGDRVEPELRDEAHEILKRLGVRDVQLSLPT